MDHWNLNRKRAVVTGATMGIGKAITEEFLKLGAEVVMVARNQDVLEQLLMEYGRKSWPVHGLAADMATAEGRKLLLQRCHELWDDLDILVNNVGTNVRKPTLEYTIEDLRQVMQVNVESAFALSQAFYSLLKKAGGTIINMSSISSQTVVGLTTAAYAMSKAAMEQMTNYMAVEWGKEGIRVNSVHPWYIKTPLTTKILEDDERREKIIGATPVGRVGIPEDVAHVVAFLAMPGSSYLNGVNIPVDGGFSKLGIQ